MAKRSAKRQRKTQKPENPTYFVRVGKQVIVKFRTPPPRPIPNAQAGEVQIAMCCFAELGAADADAFCWNNPESAAHIAGLIAAQSQMSAQVVKKS